MTISKYITELLYRYDCVILPEFGAFLTERVSAQLNAGVFYPPQKKLSFNEQIQSNDGLLANYIAVNEGVSYENANNKLIKFVFDIKNELAEKARLSLNEIGMFTLNFEKNLIFEPIHNTNYLPEAFGLGTFKATGITREQLKKEVEVIEEKVPVAFTPEKRSKFRPYKIAAAAAIAAIAMTAVGSLLYVKSVERQNSVALEEGYTMADEEIQSASFVLDIFNPLPSILIDSQGLKTKEKEPVAYTSEGTTYHVVAGAFREYENMKKKQRQLKTKGFDATYIGANKYGLHQVVYQSYTSRLEALQSLRKIKRTENNSAWLLVTKKP